MWKKKCIQGIYIRGIKYDVNKNIAPEQYFYLKIPITIPPNNISNDNITYYYQNFHILFKVTDKAGQE